MNFDLLFRSFCLFITCFLFISLILKKWLIPHKITFDINFNVIAYEIILAIFLSLVIQFDIMLVVVNFQHDTYIITLTRKFEVIDQLSRNCNGNYLAYFNLNRVNIKFLNDFNKSIDILRIKEIMESGEFFDLLNCINKVEYRISSYEFYNYLVKFTISDTLFFNALFTLHEAFDVSNSSNYVLYELIEKLNQINFILKNQKFSLQNHDLYMTYVSTQSLIEFINYVNGNDLAFERFLYPCDHRITDSQFILFLKNSIIKYGATNLERRHKFNIKSSNLNDHLEADNLLAPVDIFININSSNFKDYLEEEVDNLLDPLDF